MAGRARPLAVPVEPQPQRNMKLLILALLCVRFALDTQGSGAEAVNCQCRPRLYPGLCGRALTLISRLIPGDHPSLHSRHCDCSLQQDLPCLCGIRCETAARAANGVADATFTTQNASDSDDEAPPEGGAAMEGGEVGDPVQQDMTTPAVQVVSTGMAGAQPGAKRQRPYEGGH